MYRLASFAALGLSVLLFTFVAPATAADNAVITGKIIFKGDVKDPSIKRTVISTQKDPKCTIMKNGKKKKIGTEKVILNKKTTPVTIRNVIVSIKEGLPSKSYQDKTAPFVLDQVGCRYKPHIIAIQDTQQITVKNSDNTNHNIHLLPKKNREMNFSQPKIGMTKNIKLTKEDPFRVKCDVHPWMGAYVVVFDHPFFDVTKKAGTFTISGLPAGNYIVEAWHEKFGTQTMNVVVTVGETKTADFTFELK